MDCDSFLIFITYGKFADNLHFTYFFNSLFAIESLPSDVVAQNADGGK